VVGDADQSIYGWRGADIENILQFETHFPRARTIALGENFRSTKHIIGAADSLIRNNKKRKHKDLFTANEEGVKPEVVICRDEHHEARLVVDWLRGLRDESMAAGEPLAWKDFAVFYRTNALSRVVEDVLRNEAIPYVIARGTAFYQREEVKHALAYLRVVANPADEVSLMRIVNTPSRGIGATTLGRVEALAAQRDVGALDALRIAPESLQLASRTGAAIGAFVRMVDAWAGIHDEGMLHVPAAEGSLAELVERVIRESGLEEMYKKMGEEEAERLENLAELVSSAREYEETYDPLSDPRADPLNPDERPEQEPPPPSLLELLRGYLERVTLVADADSVDPSQGAVTLMTLHAAKGLEFAGVAMVGLEEGLLPHSRVMEHPGELEEERRLCFVGITRAMKRLMITSARYRTIRGQYDRTIESRFIHELPKQHVTISDQAGFGEPGWDRPSGRIGDARGGSDGPRFVPDGPAGGSGRGKMAGPKDSRGLPLAVGAMVRHPQFGLGRIVGLTPGQDARAQIEFRQAGRKTLVLQYARLERVEG
jgi:DNA helicase-2/ATP-dependent DNA helicase PcrA